MASKNDITNDLIKSKVVNENYLNNYDKIFRKNKDSNEKITNATIIFSSDNTTDDTR